MSTACPSCSHVNTDTARFCLKCGAPLRAPEPVAGEAPAASAPVAQPEAAPQVTSTVQETPFGSVNVNAQFGVLSDTFLGEVCFALKADRLHLFEWIPNFEVAFATKA